jgi:hypothetical protein
MTDKEEYEARYPLPKKKYDFEPPELILDPTDEALKCISEPVIISAIEALCRNCRHSYNHYHTAATVRCLQGRCDTLECIIGRLSDLPLGD